MCLLNLLLIVPIIPYCSVAQILTEAREPWGCALDFCIQNHEQKQTSILYKSPTLQHFAIATGNELRQNVVGCSWRKIRLVHPSHYVRIDFEKKWRLKYERYDMQVEGVGEVLYNQEWVRFS